MSRRRTVPGPGQLALALPPAPHRVRTPDAPHPIARRWRGRRIVTVPTRGLL